MEHNLSSQVWLGGGGWRPVDNKSLRSQDHITLCILLKHDRMDGKKREEGLHRCTCTELMKKAYELIINNLSVQTMMSSRKQT